MRLLCLFHNEIFKILDEGGGGQRKGTCFGEGTLSFGLCGLLNVAM